MSLPPSSCLSDSKRRKGWFGFPFALEQYWKVFSAGIFPLPTSLQMTPATRPLLSLQLPGCSHVCSGRRGLLVWIHLEVEKEKLIRKETFHPSLGMGTKGTLCFPSQPRTWSPQVSPAKSFQRGTWRVGSLGRGIQSVPLLLVRPVHGFSAGHN